MASLVFVHGTGVRRESFDNSFETISSRLLRHEIGLTPVECYWGDKCGTKLNLNGESIPTYATTEGNPDNDDSNLALWAMLDGDPYFELSILAKSGPQGPRQDLAPNQVSASARLASELKNFKPRQSLQDVLKACNLLQAWDESFQEICESRQLRQALSVAGSDVTELRESIARAVVALTLKKAEVDVGTFGGATRERIYRESASQLQAATRAAKEWLVGIIQGVASNMASDRLERRRGAITDYAFPFPGDVLRYQARGQEMRDFIEGEIGKNDPDEPIVLLGHSLGGIACFELLANKYLPAVRQLITVGSQAPFLAELDALATRDFGDPLPKEFPSWLNIWDRRDILSYVAQPIFGRVTDEEVDNGESFPRAHSAYWTNDQVWGCIKDFLK